MPVQEPDLTNLSKNIDSELKTVRDELGKLFPATPDSSELFTAVKQLKANCDVLLKLSAAALAQLPNTFSVEGIDVPAYRNPLAGADMPAVPPTIDPVIVPTNPPLGPPLEAAKKDPTLKEQNEPGAPSLPAT